MFRAACFLLATAGVALAAGTPYVGAYFLVDSEGSAKLSALASNAETLPFNRLWISFFSPSLVYVPNSHTLEYVGLGLSQAADYGFAELKSAIAALQDGGVEVFLSMGGWNYNCWPYMYTYYSVGGYGTNTPNYFKIQEYSSNGQLSGCTASNQWCYTCEPPSQNATLNDFNIFPEPQSPTFKQAQAYVAASANGGAPLWNTTMINGQVFTDPNTGLTVPIPGSNYWYTQGRDPYADMVSLASDLGAAGIDIDYEEMWFADSNKDGAAGGPWTLQQAVYKWTAIVYDFYLNIKAKAPSLKLSTAAPAAGAWQGNWWGGNLKGLISYAAQWYPEIVSFMSSGPNSGGINVMSYDLSSNMEYYECPTPDLCALNQQVNFYLNTYEQAGIPAGVGYETGTPAYPDPVHDPTHQLPLTSAELSLILQNTQPSFSGAFFWEAFKAPASDSEVSPTQLAQQLCNLLLPGQSRCTGSIPTVGV